MPSFQPFVQELETPRLRLRPWRPSDSPAVRALWAERDPRSLHVIDADGRPTIDDMTVRIERQLTESVRTGISLLAIERKIEGDFIGYCGLIVGNATLEEPEIAYELFRSVHGEGYASEAARAVLSAGLDTGRTRFWATVRSWNVASLRVLEKIGFIDSGRIDLDPVRGDSIWMTGPVGGDRDVTHPDEELIHATPNAPWLPEGGRAEVIRSALAPRPTSIVRLVIRRRATVYCVPREGTVSLDLPARRVPSADDRGLATALELARGVLGETSTISPMGFVRNVVDSPSPDYEWPTPRAHFSLWAAQGDPVGPGEWVSLDKSASPLVDRHWFPLLVDRRHGRKYTKRPIFDARSLI